MSAYSELLCYRQTVLLRNTNKNPYHSHLQGWTRKWINFFAQPFDHLVCSMVHFAKHEF